MFKKLQSKNGYRFIRFVIIGLFTAIINVIMLELFHFNFNFSRILTMIFETNTNILIINTHILFVLFCFLASLFGSAIIGSAILTFISLIIGIAANLKFIYRNEPLYPNELSLVTELNFFTDIVTTREIINSVALVSIFLLVFLIIYRVFSLKRRYIISLKLHYFWRFTLLILSSIFLYNTYRFNYSDNQIKQLYDSFGDAKWVTYNQTKNYSENGFTASFLYNLKGEYMIEPPNYSKSSIENIYKEYTEKAQNINQNKSNDTFESNIIFIMSESFSDPLSINNFSVNKDPIPYTRMIMENSISGEALSQTYGGGTSNSEFEALTTMALESLAPNVNSPFVEATNTLSSVPSLPKRFKNSGMNTTAIHPYSPNWYRRSEAYDYLGFENFLHENNMKNKSTIENNNYISDKSAYQEVIDTLSQTPGNDFIHLVTMQNHTPYDDIYSDIEFKSDGAGDLGNGYLQGINYSDQALEFLIDELNKRDDETIIIFWGDHLPGIFEEDVLSSNRTLELGGTPLFIFSTNDSVNDDIGLMNPIYFINYLLQIEDVKISPYEVLLLELEDNIPVLYGGNYLEKDSSETVPSRENLSRESQEILDKFTLIQYDLISGSQFSHQFNMFDVQQ